MTPYDLLDPKNFPKLMAMSAVIGLAIGWIVYNFTGNLELSVSVGVFLVVADYLGIKWLMDRRDDE